jgi:hypothetical protein
MPPSKTRRSRPKHRLDARPDPIDFRDRMYVPTLIEVPMRRPLERYLEAFPASKPPILDQGQEGACTGFGIAAVAHYLLSRREIYPDRERVSARMFYAMARRYDEWPGTDYSGSSARGAMKGWQKHGVCSEALWPYRPGPQAETLTDSRARDATKRPLGAYFRVNHRDVVAMHAALAEVGILYATAQVHSGWDAVDPATGDIPLEESIQGGHAFAIVGYDERGFWIQNSWGRSWGLGGFARVSYDDWLQNGTDVWVARLGVPVVLDNSRSQAIARSDLSGRTEAISQADLRAHVISIGNDGKLREGGPFGTTREDVREIFRTDFANATKQWKKKRLLLYAHGGLVSEQSALQRVADYREALLEAEVYPLSFVWKTDLWTTFTNIIQDAVRRRRPEGFVDGAKDFLLDRLDDGLEQILRLGGAKAVWDEIKENAFAATTSAAGGFRIAAPFIADLARQGVEIHVVGHSAGSIFHALPVQLLTGKKLTGRLAKLSGYNLPIASCTLWAPACTLKLFHECYLPAIKDGKIGRFTLFTLTDRAECDDDCAKIYNKSILYLVSNALEDQAHIPLPGLMRRPGEPLLGLECSVRADSKINSIFHGPHDWVLSPNPKAVGQADAAGAHHHGDFDDDEATLKATLARILGHATAKSTRLSFERSASSARDRRIQALGGRG